MTQINFTVTDNELEFIGKIAYRAFLDLFSLTYNGVSRMTLMMGLMVCQGNESPLGLEKLLNAEMFDFSIAPK